VGEQAEQIAAFLSQYSGLKAKKVPTVNITLSTK